MYQVSLGQVNAFLIDDKGLTLIDTGYKKDVWKLFRAVSGAGLNPAEIKQIILTHCHPDHAGGAAEIKRRLDIPVYAHVEDAPLIRQGIAGRYPWQRTDGLLNFVIYQAYIKNAPTKNDRVEVEEMLADNDVLPIAGGLRIIHTPGHSAGHISLLMVNEGIMIAGDLCANIAGPGLSTVYEDRSTGISSIAKAAAFHFDKMVFGHGKPIHHHADQLIRQHFSPAPKSAGDNRNT